MSSPSPSANGTPQATASHFAEPQRTNADAGKSERNLLQDELLAVVAHELRGPLHPIRTAAAYLARSHANGSAQDQAAIGIIERQASHLASLINDLSDASRLMFGKMRMHFEEISLSDVLASAVEANRGLVDKNDLRLRILQPHQDVRIVGDMVRLTQVFSNLVNNAAKFSAHGGAIDVRVSAEGPRRGVKVSVLDQGAGIAADIIGSVFNLFAQATPGGSEDRGGLGIGLSVVRSIAELHGGTVTVRSEGVSKGSEFIVTLPTADLPLANPDAAGGASPTAAAADACVC